MTAEILALCRAMGAGDDQEALLQALAGAVVPALEGRLKAGVALAERLLAPWLGETGFAFRGVDG